LAKQFDKPRKNISAVTRAIAEIKHTVADKLLNRVAVCVERPRARRYPFLASIEVTWESFLRGSSEMTLILEKWISELRPFTCVFLLLNAFTA
jgi:hypothetical protein